MNNASRATGWRKLLLTAVAVVLVGGAAWADCFSENERISAVVLRLSNEVNSPNVGFCLSARAIKREFPSVLEFYNRCPIVDPDGSMRQFVKQMLAWADQVESATCAN